MSRITSLSRENTGKALVVLGVVVVLGFTAVAAATAPEVDVSTEQSAEQRGKTVIGVQGKPAGRLSMASSNGTVLWTESGSVGYHDVTVLEDGSVLAATIDSGKTKCDPFDSPCHRTGFKIVDPHPEPTVERKWSYPVRGPINSEVHDVEPLPNGKFLVADMEYESIFIVNQDGSIGWRWNASQHYDAPADPTKQDWLHINDVDRISEGEYLVSVRNRNQLLFIEKGEGVTEVVNKNRNKSVMYRQHNPQYLGNDTILVADSDNNRIVELSKQNGTWKSVWTLHSAGGMAFTWPRDADRLPNGHTLITDSRNNRVVEVDENGTLVWSMSVPGLPYEADRLPHGESTDVPSMTEIHGGALQQESAAAETQVQSADLPVFSTLYAGVAHVAPTPYWMNAWHLVVWLVGLTLSGAGMVLWRPSIRRAGSQFTGTDASVLASGDSGRWSPESQMGMVSSVSRVESNDLVVVQPAGGGRRLVGRVTSVAFREYVVYVEAEPLDGGEKFAVRVPQHAVLVSEYDSEADEWVDPVRVESLRVFEEK